IRASYRDAPAHTELAPDGDSLTVLDDDGRLTLGLWPEGAGVRLRVASALTERSEGTVGRHLLPFAGVGMPSRSGATHVIGDDARLPEAPSSLVRLARWIERRLSADARAEAARDRAFGEERAAELGGTLIRLDRA